MEQNAAMWGIVFLLAIVALGIYIRRAYGPIGDILERAFGSESARLWAHVVRAVLVLTLVAWGVIAYLTREDERGIEDLMRGFKGEVRQAPSDKP